MNLIFCSSRYNSSQSIRLTPGLLTLVLGLAILIPAGLGGGLVYWWVDASERLHHSQAARLLEKELQAQREEVKQIRHRSMQRIDALTPRIGELQARLLRLDALGKRLTSIADLSDEFNFGQPPPRGGPESDYEGGSGYTDTELVQSLDSLAHQIEQRQQQLELIYSLLTQRHLADQVYLAGRPIVEGWMSSTFGRRSDPFTGRTSWHEGVDYAGRENSDVIATGAGVVVYAAPRGGFGKMVEIDHGDGYRTRYAHMNALKVAKGELVRRGDVVGLMGCTGRCTGTHVHYEVLLHGRAVDPARYISRSVP